MASTSTPKPNSPLDQALAKVPDEFRQRLITAYLELKKVVAERDHEKAGIKVGKFCEIVLRLLQHEVSGTFMPFGEQISNFADKCRTIITTKAPNVVESLRVVVPRGLVFIYTMRSKRGIGHVGGDVDANGIDVAAMARTADWTICELIRVYHSLSLEEAQDLVDGISVRQLPDIWEVNGKKRVLRSGLTAKQQTLYLLYTVPTNVVLAEDLYSWVEYDQLRTYRRDVLWPLHKARLIEFDEENDAVHLSPTGAHEVETKIIPVSEPGRSRAAATART